MIWSKALKTSITTTITMATVLHLMFLVISIIYNLSELEFCLAYTNLALIFWIPISIVFIISLLFARYQIKFLSFMLISIALLLIIASPLDNEISQNIRHLIESNYEFSYIISAITIIAFLLSFLSVFYRHKDSNRSND